MKKISVSIVLVVLALSGFAFQTVAAQGTNCTVDLTSINAALSSAQTAAQGGMTQDAVSALGQARAAIDAIQQSCITGQTAPAADAAPNCQYLFDATVRSGADKGLNLGGTLALVQSSDTAASGYVMPDAGTEPATDLVPVMAQIDGLNITLTFTLADGRTMIGTGTMEAPIKDCAGTMQGDFTGPGADDRGDWKTGAELSKCISAGVSACVAQFGTQNSKVCSANAVAACQTASNDR
jgi:hypothetical protein